MSDSSHQPDPPRGYEPFNLEAELARSDRRRAMTDRMWDEIERAPQIKLPSPLFHIMVGITLGVALMAAGAATVWLTSS
ncbi:hypothetical protein [Sphingomonas solaris]|uniref:Uncharacterized protein n=1 Tax=Alterirhizorhabdus solaris TaxID=2529389 RepID=A0A558RCI0_9SPHN|nr:hypothetical protein [Sphingomonas solaris]TVV77177.1 hypothetical protein FOY91_02300 [Sphingomonas solaris]